MHTELKRKGVTLQLLWAKYVAAVGDGAYRSIQTGRSPCCATPAWRHCARSSSPAWPKPSSSSAAQPDLHELCFEDRLALLIERERLAPDERRRARLLKAATLRLHACLEDLDTCDCLRGHHNLCLTGPTGCGKTYIACAFGKQACRQGLSVCYLRLPRLLEQLRIADGSNARLMGQLALSHSRITRPKLFNLS